MENRDDQNKNQTGQQGQQGQSTDQQNQQGLGQQDQSPTGQTGTDQGTFGQSGDDTTLAQGQKNLADKQREDEAASDKGFVGTSKEDDTSEALVETGETDFAETGQGAAEARTGTASNEDIETGMSATRDATLDDGS